MKQLQITILGPVLLHSPFHACACLHNDIKISKPTCGHALAGSRVMSGMGSDIDDVLEDIAESEGLLLGQYEPSIWTGLICYPPFSVHEPDRSRE